MLHGIPVKFRVYVKSMVIKQPEKRLCEHGKDLHIQQDNQAVCKCLVLKISIKIVQYDDDHYACTAPVSRHAEYSQHQNQECFDDRVLDVCASSYMYGLKTQKNGVNDIWAHKLHI